MTNWKCLGAVALIATLLSAQQVVQDPVLMIRSQRAASGEGNLPPVPRAILEPPPLPAPETHVKDTKGWRASRTARKARRKVVKRRRKAPVTSHIKKILKKKP